MKIESLNSEDLTSVGCSESKGPLESMEIENFTGMIKQLNRETDLEAERWFREKRRVFLPLVFWRMFHRFMKTYFFEKGWRDGFFGFMRAAHHSLYELISYTKYWELTERERGRM